MKHTGIVRKVDELGRVVIPKELREVMMLEHGDMLEFIFVDGKISINKYQPGCTFCGGYKGIKEYKGKFICINCVETIRSLNFLSYIDS